MRGDRKKRKGAVNRKVRYGRDTKDREEAAGKEGE